MTGLPSHLELVQGVVLPKPVGADPVLDFVNTRSDWSTGGPARTEWLTSYSEADADGARWRPAATAPRSARPRPALVRS
jgi:hypothetical protein